MLALPPHSKKVIGSIPAWGQVGYLLGLSVWSLHVFPVFSLTRGFLHYRGVTIGGAAGAAAPGPVG